MTKSIINCINQDLLNIYQKSAEIEQLEKTISNYLPENAKAYVKIASFNKGTLTLSCSRQDIAYELRYQLPEIRNQLRKELFQLAQIKLVVQ
jgi:hypothetical protein